VEVADRQRDVIERGQRVAVLGLEGMAIALFCSLSTS
jgi:hypothetical protein